MKRISLVTGAWIIAGVLTLSGCTNPADSITPTLSNPTTTADSRTSSTGPTYGALSASGQAAFAATCASCHGAQGQGITGPALIGPSSSLDKYMTAAMLLNFVSTAMPLNAPASLTHQQYLEVLCFLMVQNNFVTAQTEFVENDLAGVQLK